MRQKGFRKTARRLLILAIALALAGGIAIGKEQRRRVIDFEDEVVEGMNKRPLDSLSQISERNRNRPGPHLYRKRAGFSSENQETLHELRYSS